jgi:hypothetical protein
VIITDVGERLLLLRLYWHFRNGLINNFGFLNNEFVRKQIWISSWFRVVLTAIGGTNWNERDCPIRKNGTGHVFFKLYFLESFV